MRQPGDPAPAHELTGPASDPWAAFDAPLPPPVQSAAGGRVANPFDQFDDAPGPAAASAPAPNAPWLLYAPQAGGSAPGNPWDNAPIVAPAPSRSAPMPWDRAPIVARAPQAPAGPNPFDRFDPPGAASSHAASDPWAAFDGVPPAQPAADPAGEHGFAYAPGPWDNAPIVVPAPNPGVPSGSPQSGPVQRSGLAANAAAGVAEGAGDAVSVASDPFGNLIGKPLGMAIVGAHDALSGPLGYDKFDQKTRDFLLGEQTPQLGQRVVNATARALDAPSPDDVVPATPGEQLMRAGTRGAAGTAAMGAPSASPGALVRAQGHSVLITQCQA